MYVYCGYMLNVCILWLYVKCMYICCIENNLDKKYIDNKFHEIRYKSSRYMNSFFPDRIKAWNNAIGHFPNIPSINTLKGHISYSTRKRNIFIIHMTQ